MEKIDLELSTMKYISYHEIDTCTDDMIKFYCDKASKEICDALHKNRVMGQDIILDFTAYLESEK